MAIVHFINYKKNPGFAGMKSVLDYTMQDRKTVSSGKKYVTGINCTPESAYTEFRNTKRLYRKEDGRLFFHFVQSFPVGEKIDPATAHEIALRFVSESEKLKEFEIVVSTHCDRDHIHTHFVMNSVNAETGKKFHINENEIEMLMQESDALIQQYGLSVVDKRSKQKTKAMSDREYRSADSGQSWKLQLAMAIDDAMLHAVSREHFIELMSMEGYSVHWTDERKYITYTTPEKFKCRDNKLHEEKYLKENMEYEFRIRKEITEGAQRAGKAADEYGVIISAVRGSDRNELGSDDRFTENADGYAVRDHGRSNGVDDEIGYGAYTFDAESDAYEIYRSLQDNDGEISEFDEAERGQRGLADREYGQRFRETGWEDEREFFRQTQMGQRAYREPDQDTLSDLTYPDGTAYHLGTDTAYLVADIMNIIDNNHPVKDSTTMKPPQQKKKKEQNRGPVMGGM